MQNIQSAKHGVVVEEIGLKVTHTCETHSEYALPFSASVRVRLETLQVLLSDVIFIFEMQLLTIGPEVGHSSTFHRRLPVPCLCCKPVDPIHDRRLTSGIIVHRKPVFTVAPSFLFPKLRGYNRFCWIM